MRRKLVYGGKNDISNASSTKGRCFCGASVAGGVVDTVQYELVVDTVQYEFTCQSMNLAWATLRRAYVIAGARRFVHTLSDTNSMAPLESATKDPSDVP